jgi:5-formyltetrahydrofolate cyclo-ligase
MNKQELRSLYFDKRKKLTPAECAQFNLQLSNIFFTSFDLSFVKVIHIFLPIEKNNEPDTWLIIDRVRREFPGVRISIPKVGADGYLENFYFEGLHQLQTNAWGIQEPKQGVPTPADKIDMVIVPLLIFDKSGQRVGYGKGFYDRFLKDCREDCKKIGLSFFEEVDSITDSNEYDIRLNSCVTPSGLNFFKHIET